MRALLDGFIWSEHSMYSRIDSHYVYTAYSAKHSVFLIIVSRETEQRSRPYMQTGRKAQTRNGALEILSQC